MRALEQNGKRILVDPVLSGIPSPVSLTTKAFDGTGPARTFRPDTWRQQ
ncbi:MAG: hypothetical protein P4K86_13745 [Terracidiphilus sp.]|nr:hypothetical protein [Terracidiphilus sp.]MDR3777334.1 hypothetical protein [Terracidiphilus sp.]